MTAACYRLCIYPVDTPRILHISSGQRHYRLGQQVYHASADRGSITKLRLAVNHRCIFRLVFQGFLRFLLHASFLHFRPLFFSNSQLCLMIHLKCARVELAKLRVVFLILLQQKLQKYSRVPAAICFAASVSNSADVARSPIPLFNVLLALASAALAC